MGIFCFENSAPLHPPTAVMGKGTEPADRMQTWMPTPRGKPSVELAGHAGQGESQDSPKAAAPGLTMPTFPSGQAAEALQSSRPSSPQQGAHPGAGKATNPLAGLTLKGLIPLCCACETFSRGARPAKAAFSKESWEMRRRHVVQECSDRQKDWELGTWPGVYGNGVKTVLKKNQKTKKL